MTEMTFEQTAILSAALQHMRNAFNAGDDLSYLDGFRGFDPETMNYESELDAIEDELLGKEND